jgi:hypothetical protein
MNIAFSGGCLCGAVRYECFAAPMRSFKCHCRDCQRTSGSAFLPGMVVPTGALKLTQGEPKYYAVTADSGHTVSRGFCPECGSILFGKVAENPAIMIVSAVSQNDSRLFQPVADIWTSSAQPWDYMDPALAKHPKDPPH